MQRKIVKKRVVFYELFPQFSSKETDYKIAFEKIVEKINKNAKLNPPAYLKHGRSEYLIDLCSIDESKKVIKGVIRTFTSEVPELFHKKKLSLRDIEKYEDEEIVFSTHFVIRVNTDRIDLALQVIKEGASTSNLVYYIEKIGESLGITNIGVVPHVKDSLNTITKKLGRCSEFTVKVHRSNLPELNNVDSNLHTVMKNIHQQYESEYSTLVLKYDYKDRPETNKIKNTIFNIVKYLKKSKRNIDTFENLEVKGEERTKDLKIDIFDLITDKLSADVKAEQRENSKSIVTSDFLTNVAIELNTLIP